MWSIDDNRHLSECTDAAKLVKHNESLQDNILKVQDEVRRIGIASTLTIDQQDFLRIHERHNNDMSVADTQLLAATGVFLKRLSKCARLACAACSYGSSQRKS